jgi:hypothetical protein
MRLFEELVSRTGIVGELFKFLEHQVVVVDAHVTGAIDF